MRTRILLALLPLVYTLEFNNNEHFTGIETAHRYCQNPHFEYCVDIKVVINYEIDEKLKDSSAVEKILKESVGYAGTGVYEFYNNEMNWYDPVFEVKNVKSDDPEMEILRVQIKSLLDYKLYEAFEDVERDILRNAVYFQIDSLTVGLTSNPEYDEAAENARKIDEMSLFERGTRMATCALASKFLIWTGAKFVLPKIGFGKLGVVGNSIASGLQSFFAKLGFGISKGGLFAGFQSVGAKGIATMSTAKLAVVCGFDKRDLDNIMERSKRFYETKGESYLKDVKNAVNEFTAGKFDDILEGGKDFMDNAWTKSKELGENAKLFLNNFFNN